MTHIQVDRERCVGSGTCEVLAPHRFEVGDDGIVELLDGGGDQTSERDAVEACPTGALSLAD